MNEVGMGRIVVERIGSDRKKSMTDSIDWHGTDWGRADLEGANSIGMDWIGTD